MPLLLFFEDFKDFACTLNSFFEPHLEGVTSKMQLREKGQRDNGIQSYTMREKQRLKKVHLNAHARFVKVFSVLV